MPGHWAAGQVWVEASPRAAPPAPAWSCTQLRKGTRGTSGGSRRVLGIGGICLGRDRAEGVLGHGSCLHKGPDAGHEARCEEQVEAKSHGTAG